MKKLLILLIVLLSSIEMFSQNEYKYVMYFYGGVKIGSEARIASMAQRDSIKLNLGNLAFYVGANPYYSINATQTSYLDFTSSGQTQMNTKLSQDDTIAGQTVLVLLSDTIPLYHIVWGAGNAGDTVGFNLDSIFWDHKSARSHTENITQISVKARGVSPDIDLAFLTNTTPVAAGATAVTTTDVTVTTKNTWTDITTIDNPTIEPDETLMIRIDQLTQKPYQVTIDIYGYLTE